MAELSRKNILLVEDEAIIAMGEKARLKQYGYSVETVTSGEKAVERAAERGADEENIDLVLMDIDLGKGRMDGTEAARKILGERDIPVVFLSSHTDPETVEKTERITSYGYVVKNSGITVLDASIKMAFRLFEAREKEKAHEVDLRLTKAREKNLNRMLRSVRKINQLIARETDRVRLLDGACRLLTEGHGMFTAWIALLKEGRPAGPFFHSGYKGGFAPMTKQLEKGVLPKCAEAAMSAPGVRVVREPEAECAGCPLLDVNGSDGAGSGCFSVRLEYNGKVFGVLTASILKQFAENKEEQELFAEVAGDVAFALSSMGVAEELKNKEAVLLERNNFYNNVLRYVPVFILNREFVYVQVNTLAAELVHKAADELVGNKITEIFPGIEETEFFKMYARVMETGKPEKITAPFIHPDGETGWYQVNILPCKAGVQCIALNITGVKRMEEIIAVSEEKFRNIFTESPIGIELYDGEGKLTDANRACLDIFGVGKIDDAAGFNLFDDPNVTDEHKKQLRSGESVSYNAVFDFQKVRERHLYQTSKTGKIHIHVLITPVRGGETTAVSGFLVQVQDITEIMKDRELREQVSRLNALRASMWELSASMHEETEMIQSLLDTAGPALELENISYMPLHRGKRKIVTKRIWRSDGTQTGIGESVPVWIFNKIRGKRYFQFGLENVPAFAKPIIAPIMKKYGTQSLLIVPFGDKADPDGFITASAYTRARTFTPVEIDFLVETVTIINVRLEQLRSVLLLNERNEEKDLLIKEVHHRVKNNMNIVRSLLSMQAQAAKDRQTEWALHEAMNRVALMAKVYERLYTVGDMREIDLQPFLEEVAETAASSYDMLDTVTVFTRFDDITISSNEAVNIGIIVNELLTNCFKYAFPGKMRGTVDISVKGLGNDRLEIVVRDNGVGADAGAVEESGGFGLGLVRSLAGKYGGSVDITSNAGTEVRVVVRR